MELGLKGAFEEKYPKYAARISELFEEANGCSFSWEKISKPRLARFVKYADERLSKSSVKTYCAMFKAVLNLYNNEVTLPNGYAAILSVKNDVSENTWLTEEDINKIISFVPANRNERMVRNQFVLGCLTGARHSDYVHFTRGNIKRDKVNIQPNDCTEPAGQPENCSRTTERLVYVSQKTHIRAEVPLSPVVERLIIENERAGMIGVEVTTHTFNTIIREICQAVGITERLKLYQGGKYQEGEKWEFISSHSARRSFATNLYLRGADLYLISKLMGHSSTGQTEGYICCGIRSIPDAVTAYFQEFK